MTFESAAYVAGYVTKRRTGPASECYLRVSPTTGEEVAVLPEYGTMSRRPGIGRGWLEQFATEVYPADSMISRGREVRPPRYFDKILASVEPTLALEVAYERMRDARVEDQTPERLQVREVCAERQLTFFEERGL